MIFQSLLSKNKTNKTNNNNNNTNTTNTYQDEEDLYSAEVDDQTTGDSFVYGATPVETTTGNTIEKLSIPASMENVTEENEGEVEASISLNFDGEDKDTFVLVSGILGFDTIEINLPGGRSYTIADYWGGVKEVVEDPIIVKPSPFGSVHDRAVEIFYQLKGGRVDYGLAHSHRFCHKQLGQTYDGVIPDWDADNPIVLIGKGYGATTALHLQHLLETNFFSDHETSGRWIKAIICKSAPHRGSTLPYLFGLEPGTMCVVVNPFSILQLLLTMVHLICYFACLERLFSFQLLSDRWRLRRRGRDGGEQSLWGAIFAQSRFSYFGDNFLFDWSVEGARARNTGEEKNRHRLNNGCVYINYMTTGSSWRSKVTGHYWPRLSWENMPTCLISFFLGRYKFSSDSEQNALRTSSSTFWENDGTISVYSQQPPSHQPIHMNMALNEKLFDPVEHHLMPGAWYNLYVEDRSHTVLFADNRTKQQRRMFSFSFSLLFLKFYQLLPSIITDNSELIPKRLRDWNLKVIECLDEPFSSENLEFYYIISIEFFEKYIANFISNLLFLSSGDDYDEVTTTNNNNNNNNNNLKNSSSKSGNNKRVFIPNNDNDDLINILDYSKDLEHSPKLSYSGSGGGGNNNRSKISDRIVKRTSDKAALEWMSGVETTGVLSSPSRLLYWMNQSHYTVLDNQNRKNNQGMNNNNGINVQGKIGKNSKNNNNNKRSTFLRSTDDFINSVQNSQPGHGPMFIKARHKMTAEDYKATIMNGNAPYILQ